MQFLASRECYYVDKYQKLNQCLEQCPDGRNMYENVWKKEKTDYEIPEQIRPNMIKPYPDVN